MTFTSVIFEGNGYSTTWTVGPSATVQAARVLHPWQDPLARSFLPFVSTILNDGSLMLFPYGTQSFIMAGAWNNCPTSMSMPRPAGTSVADSENDNWTARFDDFLSSLAQVEHDVDSSRTSIY